MELTDLIIQYIRDEIIEKIEESEDYKAAKAMEDTAEEELLQTLTKKQRVLFRGYMKRKYALTSIALAHLLESCTLVVPGAPGLQ